MRSFLGVSWGNQWDRSWRGIPYERQRTWGDDTGASLAEDNHNSTTRCTRFAVAPRAHFHTDNFASRTIAMETKRPSLSNEAASRLLDREEVGVYRGGTFLLKHDSVPCMCRVLITALRTPTTVLFWTRSFCIPSLYSARSLSSLNSGRDDIRVGRYGVPYVFIP